MVWGWWFSCHVRLFAKPWTVACQASLSAGFSRQEYWGGLPFSSPQDLRNPGIKPGSPTFQMDSFLTEPWGKPDKRSRKAQISGPPLSPDICYMDNGEKGWLKEWGSQKRGKVNSIQSVGRWVYLNQRKGKSHSCYFQHTNNKCKAWYVYKKVTLKIGKGGSSCTKALMFFFFFGKSRQRHN